MRICDMKNEDIKIGLRIKSFTGKNGTVVKIDESHDNYAWIQWDGEKEIYSGFFFNDCECEVVCI